MYAVNLWFWNRFLCTNGKFNSSPEGLKNKINLKRAAGVNTSVFCHRLNQPVSLR